MTKEFLSDIAGIAAISITTGVMLWLPALLNG